MLHEPDVLAGRLTRLGDAPDTPEGRVAALRELFAAAGCTQVGELGDGDRRNVECIVPGRRPDTIVVGVNQFYDSLGSVALLPSLAEALAAAPREHTYRWVAFSSHETVADRVNRVQKPKGATRLLASLGEEARVRAMIHVGPIGFGAYATHPDVTDPRLACAMADAAEAVDVELTLPERPASDCLQSGTGPQSTGRAYVGCRPKTNWTGAADWQPFRRAGIPLLGLHSRAPMDRDGGKIEPASYLRGYRLLAVFLALADEALAPPAGQSAAH
jgi:hypothetical protein